MKQSSWQRMIITFALFLALTLSCAAEELLFTEEAFGAAGAQETELFNEESFDAFFEDESEDAWEAFTEPTEEPFFELPDDANVPGKAEDEPALIMDNTDLPEKGMVEETIIEEAPAISEINDTIAQEEQSAESDTETTEEVANDTQERDTLLEIESRDVSSGTCGENLTWTLDENGKLTISGTGPMRDFLTTNELPWHGMRINELVIESGVTSIGNYAFCEHEPTGYEVMRFETVDIPSTVTSIGKNAFRYCRTLNKVIIPESVTRIGENAFQGTNLTSAGPIGSNYDIEFDWWECIPAYAFSGCTKLTKVYITEGIKTIGDYAFSDCSSLWNLMFSTTLKEIGYKAFSGCSSLTIVDILSSIESIGGRSFENCTSLTNVNIFDGLTNIGEEAFCGCTNLEEFYVSAGNTKYSALKGWLCDDAKMNLLIIPPKSVGEELVIPEGVIGIDGNSLLKECKGLKKVTLPYSFKWYDFWKLGWGKSAGPVGSECDIEFKGSSDTIPTEAIGAWDGKSLIIPEGVKSMAENAIVGGIRLESITIPSTLSDIILSDDVLANHVKFSIQVAEGNPSYSSINGALLNKDKTVFLLCPYGVTGEYTVPSGVKTIADSAFASCYYLTDITLPEGVTTVEENAFYDCMSLKSVWFPSTLTSIGYAAFSVYDISEDYVGPEVYYNGTRAQAQGISIGLWNSFSTWHYLGGEGDVDYNYMIAFDKNSESANGEMDSVIGVISEGKRLPANTFTYPGMTFTGWNTMPDGSGIAYTDQESIKNIVHEDYAMIILYAQWQFTNPHTDTQDYSYKIEFKKNHSKASGTMKSVSGKVSEKKSLPANKFTRKGFDFKEWNTEADGTGKSYIDQISISQIVDKDNAEITLYAQWKIKTFLITYDLNGGKDGPKNQTKEYNETLYLSEKEPTKDGYNFKGWATSPSNAAKGKVTYKPGKKLTGNKPLSLVAVWEGLPYKILFNAGTTDKSKITGKMSTKTFRYGKETALPKVGFKAKGYEFKGWDNTENGMCYQDKEKVSIPISLANLTTSAEITLTAIWEPVKYMITLVDGNPGYHTGVGTFWTSIESPEIQLPKLEEPGYVFLGWTKKAKWNKKDTIIKKIPAGNMKSMSLYGHWQEAKPVKLNCKEKTLDLKISSTVQLVVEEASGAVTWRSNNPEIATVNDTGLVTAVSNGQTEIIAESCGLSASCKITVNPVTCRALLIGNTYEGIECLPECHCDVDHMETVLRTLTNTPYEVVKKKDMVFVDENGTNNLNVAINEAFSSADQNDVSLFYFAGHGVKNTGELVGSEPGFRRSTVSPSQLRQMLDGISGRKVVLIDNCFSGNFISRNSESFEENFITGFSIAERSSSDLADSGYYVITASSRNEESQSTNSVLYSETILKHEDGLKDFTGVYKENGVFYWVKEGDFYQVAEKGGTSYMTYSLVRGLGFDFDANYNKINYSPSLKADGNGDNMVSFSELYNFVKSDMSAFVDHEGNKLRHSPQCFPDESNDIFFAR